MDPQGNATSGMGLDKQELGASTYEVLMGEAAAEEAIRPSGIRHMDILPANRHLVGAAVELVDAENREGRLRDALAPVRTRYHYIYIDCPPALNLLTVNSLAAAKGVLVTLQCEYYALEGLSELLQTISRVREGMNPHLELEGVLLTMYQHTRRSNQVIADVREHMCDKSPTITRAHHRWRRREFRSTGHLLRSEIGRRTGYLALAERGVSG